MRESPKSYQVICGSRILTHESEKLLLQLIPNSGSPQTLTCTRQNVFVKNGIAKVYFDKDGLAIINTFKNLDRWHQDAVVLNGQQLSQFDVEVNYVELKMNTVETRLPGGGIRSDSIENGTSKIYEVRYK